jgi:hypothetical protein
MKKIIVVSLVFLAFLLELLSCILRNDAMTAEARTYSTTFPAAENPISEGGVWTNAYSSWTNVATSIGFAHGTMPGGAGYYADSYAFLSGFGNDHQVDVVLQKNVNEGEVEILLRASRTESNTYAYECLLPADGTMALVSWDGAYGSYTSLASATGYTSTTGDTFRAKIVGNVITVSTIHSGVETVRITFTDTGNRHPTGQPGMGFFVSTGVSNTSFGISQFSATDGNNTPSTPNNLRIINITH